MTDKHKKYDVVRGTNDGLFDRAAVAVDRRREDSRLTRAGYRFSTETIARMQAAGIVVGPDQSRLAEVWVTAGLDAAERALPKADRLTFRALTAVYRDDAI